MVLEAAVGSVTVPAGFLHYSSFAIPGRHIIVEQEEERGRKQVLIIKANTSATYVVVVGGFGKLAKLISLIIQYP